MAGGTGNDADESITGINVTPLVDITLVLLIIFMVTAKIIVSQSVPLDLPKAVFSIVIPAIGNAQIDSKPIASDDAILPIAREAHAKNAELRAVIKADSAVPHGRVIHVLDLLKQAGVAKIAFGVTPISPLGEASGAAPAPPPPPPP
jgi:biopolymer transport protein ExbD